jgi:capsular polysaccharide transport system permease protein
MSYKSRTSFEITVSTWRALFLREALDRMFEARAAWLWLMFEPIVYISIHAFGFETFHIDQVGGMAINMWIISGFVGFLLWRRTWVQVLHGVDSNRAFFAYRQVKPFDVALVRAVVELFLMLPVSTIIYFIALATGHSMTLNTINPQLAPSDPLLVALTVFGLWTLAIGFGLVTSVIMHFAHEIDHFFKVMYLPLYYISGALLPISRYVPENYQYIFVANPIVDGVELMRVGFYGNYHALQGVSLSYLYFWALLLMFLGLALYKRYEKELIMR